MKKMFFALRRIVVVAAVVLAAVLMCINILMLAIGNTFLDVDFMKDNLRRNDVYTGMAEAVKEAAGTAYRNSDYRSAALDLYVEGILNAAVRPQVLARASAAVTHNHPEGIKGAEAVAAAVFLAKTGKTKEEIGQYLREHYYKLDFTLDAIRDSYAFDGSCQGSVPQAVEAFLESDSFEDAIRNIVSIGGDTDTTGAITGSIAWTYYTVQFGGYGAWAEHRLDAPMLEVEARAKQYLPQEIAEIAEEFHAACVRRAGTDFRVGTCTPILNAAEEAAFLARAARAPKADGAQRGKSNPNGESSK